MYIFDKIFYHVHRFQIAKGDYKFKKASNMQKISWNDDLAILGLSMCFDEFLSKILSYYRSRIYIWVQLSYLWLLITWTEFLAQNWVNQCLFEHESNRSNRSFPTLSVGQNLGYFESKSFYISLVGSSFYEK